MSLFRLSASTSHHGHAVTAWRGWDEWRRCYANMFASADDSTQQTAAVDMVRCWRARGRVPLAVDCTAQLVELNLQHAQPAAAAAAAASSSARPAPAPACSTLASRHQYALCLLRLVNGILDPQQSKQHAQSIASLAKQVDLPRILVDIRHEATHQQLPSLPMLQMASRAALEWLQRHYWNAQSHALSKTEDTLRAQLKAYKKALERSAAAAAASGKAAARDEAAIAVSVNNGDTIFLTDTSAAPSIASLPEKAVDALKALFSFLSSGHTLAHTKSIVESTLVPLLLSDAAMIKPPKQSRVSLSSVFRRLVETWDAALSVLAQRLKSQAINLPQMLLQAIVDRLAHHTKSSSSSKQEESSSHWEPDLLREWALHLLNAHASTIFRESASAEPAASASSSSTPAKKRSHATAMAAAAESTPVSAAASSPLDTLLHSCLTHLNPWTLALVSVLFPLFKASHNATTHDAEAVKALEALLAVTTRALFPDQRIMQSATVGAVTAVKNPTPLADIRAFIAAHSSIGPATPSAAASSSSAAVPASSSSASSAPSRLLVRAHDFPFLPLGVSPGEPQLDLWLEDGQALAHTMHGTRPATAHRSRVCDCN